MEGTHSRGQGIPWEVLGCSLPWGTRRAYPWNAAAPGAPSHGSTPTPLQASLALCESVVPAPRDSSDQCLQTQNICVLDCPQVHEKPWVWLVRSTYSSCQGLWIHLLPGVPLRGSETACLPGLEVPSPGMLHSLILHQLSHREEKTMVAGQREVMPGDEVPRTPRGRHRWPARGVVAHDWGGAPQGQGSGPGPFLTVFPDLAIRHGCPWAHVAIRVYI